MGRTITQAVSTILLAGALIAPRATESAGQHAASPEPRPPVVIAVVGDLLFDRGVRDEIERTGMASLFSGVSGTLKSADLAVGNLECPLTSRGLRSAKPYSFRGDPAAGQALADAGFDVLSLANNHSLDYGRTALVDTMATLTSAGITPVGAGLTRGEALAGTIVTVGTLRIGFVGYCDLFVEGTTPREDAPGIGTGDDEAFLASIREATKRSDIVVVLVHWGAEYKTAPTTRQRELGRKALAAGASLVLGAHPHVLQPVERTGGKLIAYSLGNFVFDQRRPPSSESAILLVKVTAEGVAEVDFVPVVIEACRPAPVTGETADRIGQRLNLHRCGS